MGLIVKAKVKEYAKIDDKALNVSADLAEKLNEKVVAMVKEACVRAKANGRTTVMAKDL